MVLNAVLISVPSPFIAATAPKAIRATTRAYSTKSCPSSVLARFKILTEARVHGTIDRPACMPAFDLQAGVFTPARSRKLGADFRSPISTLAHHYEVVAPVLHLRFHVEFDTGPPIRNSLAPSGFEAATGAISLLPTCCLRHPSAL